MPIGFFLLLGFALCTQAYVPPSSLLIENALERCPRINKEITGHISNQDTQKPVTLEIFSTSIFLKTADDFQVDEELVAIIDRFLFCRTGIFSDPSIFQPSAYLWEFTPTFRLLNDSIEILLDSKNLRLLSVAFNGEKRATFHDWALLQRNVYFPKKIQWTSNGTTTVLNLDF